MRWLLTGASGQLGGYLLRELRARHDEVVAWSGSRAGETLGVPWHPVDLSDAQAVVQGVRDARPDRVLHAGALARVEECQRDPEQALRVNRDGSRVLAEAAHDQGARLLLVSTDLVFDGEAAPYREEAEPRPWSQYGRSKADAERVVLAVPGTTVARLSLLYGPHLSGRPGFFTGMVDALRAGRDVALFADEWRTPLALSTAAQALIELAVSGQGGLWHLGGPERLSRLEMGRQCAEILGIARPRIRVVSRLDLPGLEPRPRDCSLESAKWRAAFPHLPWPRFSEALASWGLR